MTEEKLNEYKSRLTEELVRIKADLTTIAKLNEATGDWVAIPPNVESETADQNLEADTTEEWNERRATVAQLETRYRNIERALGKFEAGEYGKCEISGDEIEEKRLDANPAARTNITNIEREGELPM